MNNKEVATLQKENHTPNLIRENPRSNIRPLGEQKVSAQNHQNTWARVSPEQNEKKTQTFSIPTWSPMKEADNSEYPPLTPSKSVAFRESKKKWGEGI
jgi:hypothetical protein